MNQKTNTNITDKIADTLFIPLYMRAKLTKQNSPIIVDNSAVALCEQVDYDFSKYDKADMSLTGCGVRADYFDRLCVKQIKQSHHDNRRPVVVCIGCGLDNRLARVKAHLQGQSNQQQKNQKQKNQAVQSTEKKESIKTIDWYEMDLPEVIELRKQLLPIETNNLSEQYQVNHEYIDDSLLENTWLEKILAESLSDINTNTDCNTDTSHQNIDYIFIIEGVLMYFEESVVKDFFLRIADLTSQAFARKNITPENRPNMTFGFDTTATFGVKNSRKHDTVKHTDTDVTFKWAVEDDHILHTWHKGYELQSRENIMMLHKNEWSLFGKLARLVPKFRDNSRILVYKLS